MNPLLGTEVPWEPDASLFESGARLWRFAEPRHGWREMYVVTNDSTAAVDGAKLVAIVDGMFWSRC
jgi:hypothetical protein